MDTAAWDDCVRRTAGGPRLYGLSAWLDGMADRWDGLVHGSYEMVFPLVRRSRLGVEYLHHPPLSGPFQLYGIRPEGMRVTDLLRSIPARFRLCDINILSGDGAYPAGCRIRRNHVLSLAGDSETLATRYRHGTRLMVKRSVKAGDTIMEEGLPFDAMLFAARRAGVLPGLRHDQADRFCSLCRTFSASGMAFTVGVTDARGRLSAGAVFCRFEDRIHYLVGWNDRQGRRTGASFRLLDHVIGKFAGRGLTLDFEGSDIPGIAFFFEGFGARYEEYAFIRLNRLPWPLKFLKS